MYENLYIEEIFDSEIMTKSKNEKVSAELVNEINVSGKLKIKHWENLKVKLDVEKNDCWNKAFKFFEIRINTRYLEPIKRIQTTNRNHGEGFAMVNLQCSLIETIESFYNGWIYQHENEKDKNGKTVKYKGYYKRETEGDRIHLNNQCIFESFFIKRFPFIEKGIDGESFYKNVRCTLLYETQTKNDWLIKAENKNPSCFYEEKENKKIIYRNDFQLALNNVIQYYKAAIVNGQEYGEISVIELRKNFKAKFDHICKIS
ncbi:MAG: hypothetical protein ACOC2U_02075 [bacterium]